VVLAVVVTAAAACTGTGDDEPAATMEPTLLDPAVTHTTPAPAPATTPTDDEAAIIAAVHGYWDAIIDSSNPPDRRHPELARFATGEALTVALRTIERRESLRQGVRLPEGSAYRHAPVLERLETARAVIRDCSIDDSVVYDLNSGQVLNDAVATNIWRTSLVYVDGGWKVASNELISSTDGFAPCPGS